MLGSLGEYSVLVFPSQSFVWESSWGGFRPITRIAWNGSSHIVDDKEYCQDMTSDVYGYGSDKMKILCDALTTKYMKTVPVGTSLYGGNTEWLYDRFVSLTPCAPRTKESWRRLCNGQRRTCRNPPHGKRQTRRRI